MTSPSSLIDPRPSPSSDTANALTKHAWSQIVRGDADSSAKKPHPPMVPHAERPQQHPIPTIAPVSIESEKTQVRVSTQTNAEPGAAPYESSNLSVSTLEEGDGFAVARVFDEASANAEEAAEAPKSVADATESGGLNAVAVDGTEASQNKSSKSSPGDIVEPRVWRKPSIVTEGESKPQPVMGAFAWPALAEARSSKASETRKLKPPGVKTPPSSPATASASIQEPLSKASLHSGDGLNHQPGAKHKPSFKGGFVGSGRPAFQPIENGSSSLEHPMLGAHGGSEQSIKHNMHARTKGNFSGNPAMDHERAPHHRNDGMGPFSNNVKKWRNNNRDHGRGNYGWHHHGRPYENAGDMFTLLHEQRIGPRNMPRPHPLMNVNPAFYPIPNYQNGGMYYVPAGAPEFVHGPPYFSPMAPPGGMMHGPDPLALRSMLLKQIDYYFSIENLCRDVFLRTQMDEQGFVPVSVIARFNRIRTLSPNPMVILEALQQSAVVEVQRDRIRRRNDGGKWKLSPDQVFAVNPGQENIAFVNSTEGDHRKHERVDQRGDRGSVPSLEEASSGTGAASVMPLTDDESARLRPDRSNCIGGPVGLQEGGAQHCPDDPDPLKVHHGNVVDMDGSSQSHDSDFRVGRTDRNESSSLTGNDSAGHPSAALNSLQVGNELKSSDKATQRQENCLSDARFSEGSCMASQATVDEKPVSFWMENNAYFMHEDFEQDGSLPSDSSYMLKSQEDDDEDSVDVNDRDVQRLIDVTHAPLSSFIAVP
eukprot:c24339_g8_i1 orf=633-2921(-)